jgi:hypothetical protein
LDTTYHLSPRAVYHIGAKQRSEIVCSQQESATRRQCSGEGGGVSALIGAQHVSQSSSGCLVSAGSIALRAACDHDGHVVARLRPCLTSRSPDGCSGRFDKLSTSAACCDYMPNRSPGSTPLADSDASEIEQLIQYSSTRVQAHTSPAGTYVVNQANYQTNYFTIIKNNSQNNLGGASGTFGVMCKLLCFAFLQLRRRLCRKASRCMLSSQASRKQQCSPRDLLTPIYQLAEASPGSPKT